MYKVCIFDMDGTILNTLESIASFGNEALEQLGYQPIPVESYRRMVGNGADMLMQRMLAYGENPISAYKQLREKYDKLYEADPLKLVKVYPGIEEAMINLKKSGVKLGVLSNKPDNVTKEIAEQIFPGIFDLVVGQQENIPVKPDPSALIQMIKEFGATPDEVLYCGDSEVDMQTGKRAGVYTVGVNWGFRDVDELRVHGADCLVATAEELYIASVWEWHDSGDYDIIEI